MAALRTIHPCAFAFRTTNIRRVGNTIDPGPSLSGFSEKIEADGGGFIQADFSDGSARDKTTGNAYRAIVDSLGGGTTAVNVLFCAERLFQPVGPRITVPHSDATPFSDDSEYVSPGADYSTTADAALRATSLQYTGVSELALVGGEWFSVQHPTWGWRAYRVNRIDGDTISFMPPLREAVPSGTPLEFDTPRCQVVLAAFADLTTSMGRLMPNLALSFIEDMRNPAS